MSVPMDLRLIARPDRITSHSPNEAGVGWTPPKGDRAKPLGTCGLPATARGFVCDFGAKRVTTDVTIGRNPSTGPRNELRVGISRLVIEVEGDGVGEVLTQGEVSTLPFGSMLIETVRLAIAVGASDQAAPTRAMAEKLVRPAMAGGTRRGEAADRYRRALAAAEKADREGRTVWRAVAAACPRLDIPNRSRVGGEAAQREAAKRLLSRARRQRAAGLL